MELLEIYTDAEGETHFRTATVPFEMRSFAPPSLPLGVSPDARPTAAFFLELPPGWDKSFHPTPRKQIGVILSGEVTIAATDGEVRRFGPGGYFLLNDANSKGHLTQVQGDTAIHALMIAVE